MNNRPNDDLYARYGLFVCFDSRLSYDHHFDWDILTLFDLRHYDHHFDLPNKHLTNFNSLHSVYAMSMLIIDGTDDEEEEANVPLNDFLVYDMEVSEWLSGWLSG